MGVTGILDIARTALAATQQVLSITSHNIANINTPGYSRQEAILTESQPLATRTGQLGTGVSISTIRRSVDSFIEDQLTASLAQVGRFERFASTLLRLEGLFSDSTEQGIGVALTEFFNAVQDVATNPADATARTALLSKANSLAGLLNRSSQDLTAERKALDRQVNQVIGEVNSLSSEIATLNTKIADAEIFGQNANDLRDQRQIKINELSERVAITTIENSRGQVSVFVGQGQVIVDGNLTRQLVGVPSLANEGLRDVGYNTGGTTSAVINSLLTGGKLKGLLDARDQTIPGLITSLDKLAGTLTNEINQPHRLGYGLDASTGNLFFNALSVTAKASTTNTGSATIGSGAITANSLLTFDQYEIRFSSATAYSIIDTTTGINIKGNYTGTAITALTQSAPVNIITGTNDTLNVTVDGTASGGITLTGAASPGLAYTTGAALATEIQTRINADATLTAAGRSVTVTFDTSTNRFIIRSNSTASTSVVNVTGGTARATLGLTSGTSTAASGTYSSPQTFNLDGMSVALTGTPAANDVFTVNSLASAATNIGVAITDGNKVAASSTLSGVPSGNDNALTLSAVKEKSLAALGNTTLSGFYSVTAAEFGSTAQKAENDFKTEEFLHQQIEAFRAETSGVSLDEELVKLIEFQRAFEAASRLIILADELLEILLSLKR